MMLEQTLINPNFLGRDGFRWFIGVATNERDCSDSSGGYRVKVRIIGHHPGDEYLKDKDLPWAQLLIPPTMGTGMWGAGCSFAQDIAGSTVIGFFLDGDDGQQPVIIGSLFTGSNVEITQALNKGTANFKPFVPPSNYITNQFNVPLSQSTATNLSSGDPTNKDGKNTTRELVDPAGVPASDGKSPDGKTKSAGAEATQNGKTITIPSRCKTGTDLFSKILQALRGVVSFLRGIQNIQSTYIDPVLNKIQDIPGEIQKVAQTISDAISVSIKWVRDKIITAIYTKLKGLLDQIKLPKDLEFLKKVAFEKIADGIWCAIGKVLKRVIGFVDSFLSQLINYAVSMPLCALEAAAGSIIQAITNDITAAITPIIEDALETLGEGIGQVSSYISAAIGYVKEAINFLSCETKECKEQFDYEMNKGFVPKGDVNFEKILSYSPAQGVSNLLTDATKSFQDWAGISDPPEGSTIVGRVETGPGVFTTDYLTPDGQIITRTEGGESLTGNCNVVSLECGLPTVSIFGGGGSGATGNVVVDSLGQIMGVNITNPGSGYVSEPNVYFEDACDNGRGTQAVAVIGDVPNEDGTGTTSGVTDIVILEPGTNYLGPDPDDNPLDDDGKSVVGIITSVLIPKPGIGYTEGDTITDDNSDVLIEPVTGPNGQIIAVNIINPGSGIKVYPRLQINTQTGEGAELIPVLRFNPVPEITPELNQNKVGKIVYCAEDHGR
jgi:hypothetical protein